MRVKRFFKRQHALCAGTRIRVRQQQAKLIAANACDDLIWEHAGFEHSGGCLNHVIPDIISKCVVDKLQSIDIDKHDGERQGCRLIK
ncbi:hypothetical protein SDC9_195407 [bioreactor metagenome]|uniref:Uncharacterized protein n=1 Tax=bioreactor metagenome TaxID=1076179 RepID=A0A645IKF0_9ZZZZ